MKKKHLILNFGWLLIDKIFKSLGAFFINLQVITYLSIRDYGTLNYGLSINIFLLAFLGFYREILVREYATAKDEIEIANVFVSSTLIRVLTVVLCSIVVYFFFRDSLALTFILFSGLLNFSDIPEAYWQSKGQMNKPIITRVVVFFVFGCLKLYLLTKHGTLIEFSQLFLFESLAYFITTYLYFLIENRITRIDIPLLYSKAKYILVYSIPLLLNNICTAAYMRIDQVVIKEQLGDAYLGMYSFTLNIAEMLQAIPFMLGIAIAPMIFGRTDMDVLKMQIEEMMKYMLGLGLICVTGLLLVFPFVAYHYKLPSTIPIMVILALGTYPTFISYLASKYLIHTGQINHFLKRSLIASVISLGINYFFVLRFGLYASAVTYALSQWYIGYFSNKSLDDNELYYIQKRALLSLFKYSTYVSFVKKTREIATIALQSLT